MGMCCGEGQCACGCGSGAACTCGPGCACGCAKAGRGGRRGEAVALWTSVGVVVSMALTTVLAAPSGGAGRGEAGGASAGANQEHGMAQPSEDEMKLWIEAGTPGPSHRMLDQFVGTWEGKTTFWMAPGAPAQESTGTMVNAWTLDGRWLKQDWAGDMGGQAFTGLAMWGYDNIRKVHVGTWMDSLTTGILVTEGPASKDGKAFESRGEWTDPMGVKVKARMVIRVQSPTAHVMEMYETKPGQPERMSMRITYTKK